MSTAQAASETTEFVDFWNEILLPKFVKYKHSTLVNDGSIITDPAGTIQPPRKIGECYDLR